MGRCFAGFELDTADESDRRPACGATEDDQCRRWCYDCNCAVGHPVKGHYFCPKCGKRIPQTRRKEP